MAKLYPNFKSGKSKRPARPVGGVGARDIKGATPRSYETHPSTGKGSHLQGAGCPKVARIPKGLKVR